MHAEHGDATNELRAEVILGCVDVQATVAFFVEVLRFRIDSIHPAEDPRVAVISGHGVRLRLERGGDVAPGSLRIACDDPRAIANGATELLAPNGTRIALVESNAALELPPLRASFVLSKLRDAKWIEGRASMRYRDLLPDRQGGRFVASHIRIPNGGPVPDYVHFHDVRFQMIYCAKGWVRVVYEDQGAPFVLEAGDCVLQPPRIRHRVLESSPNLEVIEIGSPAEHETHADHAMTLPTRDVRADRDFGGQRFVRHEARRATWQSRADGWESRDLGIAAATRGLAGAEVLRAGNARLSSDAAHDGELLFRFVLSGSASLRCDGRDDERLVEGDAYVVPAGTKHAIDEATTDLEMLEITLAARAP